MSSRWRSYDEVKISEILKELAEAPKSWSQLWERLSEKGKIGSKTTLDQYLKHLIADGTIRKIVSPTEGTRLAYEIISEEQETLAREAADREVKMREAFSSIIPPEDPMDPRAIKIIRDSFKPSPKPTPYDNLSVKIVRIICVYLEELKSQLEMWEKIKTSGEPSERPRYWIANSFERFFSRIRMDFNWMALLMNAGFYNNEELMEAIDLLHKEYIEMLSKMPTI